MDSIFFDRDTINGRKLFIEPFFRDKWQQYLSNLGIKRKAFFLNTDQAIETELIISELRDKDRKTGHEAF